MNFDSVHQLLSRFPVPVSMLVQYVQERRARSTLLSSGLFDSEWYLRENPDVLTAKMDPVLHYLRFGASGHRDPGPDFCGDEYLALNPDVAFVHGNPLLHFTRYGRREGRPVSFLDLREPDFPAGAIDAVVDFSPLSQGRGRTAVFASYSGNGRISDGVLCYLRGLREIADDIIFIADNPVFPDEVRKLEPWVRHAEFHHHGEYDFGSYKRGFSYAREHGLLDSSATRELVIANDSCYAPVFPFPGVFQKMESGRHDFWGMTQYPFFGRNHIQSFFFVFRRRILDSDALDVFFSAVSGRLFRGHVITKYEVPFTEFLVKRGFSYATLVPGAFFRKHKHIPIKMPLTIMAKHGMPLLKRKAVNGDSYESVDKTLAFLKRANPKLARCIVRTPIHPTRIVPFSMEQHRASMDCVAHRISERIASGEPVRAVFLVSSVSMFAARPLLDAMLENPVFRASIAVVPDFRIGEEKFLLAMRDTERELRGLYPPEMFIPARQDEFGNWNDVLADADIACYSTPYSISDFRYNPRWSVGRSFLPIHVNYGFYRSVYDRNVMARQNYAYFWKAFFECEETLQEYREHSLAKGSNAELVGYVKMDRLAKSPNGTRPPNGRKTVLLCPHHSVESGLNNTLGLSNFLRYSDYFLSLPARFPSLDFILRPHPFLFEVLSRPSFWGAERASQWKQAWLENTNASWSEKGDYFPVFEKSDACIQDCGSYLVEYFYTGKPQCYMLKSPEDIGAKFSPLGQECLKHCHLAFDSDAIDRFLRDVVLAGNDPLSEGRCAFAKHVMHNHPHASEAAVAAILAGLNVAGGGSSFHGA